MMLPPIRRPMLSATSVTRENDDGRSACRIRMYLGISGAAVAISAYLLLVPKWGWKGALAGTYASEIFVATSGWVLLITCERRHDRRKALERDARPAPEGPQVAPEQVTT